MGRHPDSGMDAAPPARTDGGRSPSVGAAAFDAPALAYVEHADGEGAEAPDPVVDSVNDAFVDAFDCRADTATGRPLAAVLDSCAAPAVDVSATVAAALAGESPPFTARAGTTANTASENRAADAADAARPTDADGRRYLVTRAAAESGGLLVFVDITDRDRRIEALETEHRRITESVHAIVHDVRNPLEVASIRVEAAHETGELSHLETATEALDRIEQLLGDLSVGMSDELHVDARSRLDLSEAAREAWSMVHTRDATLDVGDGLGTVAADAGHLQRLFENLFRNAVEHGGEDVAVSVDSLDDGFAVVDDGPGVPADRRERVLDVGYTSTEDGTGLGLAIVERIATAHGWDVDVGVGPDGGAAIRLTGIETGRNEGE